MGLTSKGQGTRSPVWLSWKAFSSSSVYIYNSLPTCKSWWKLIIKEIQNKAISVRRFYDTRRMAERYGRSITCRVLWHTYRSFWGRVTWRQLIILPLTLIYHTFKSSMWRRIRDWINGWRRGIGRRVGENRYKGSDKKELDEDWETWKKEIISKMVTFLTHIIDLY